MSDDTKNLPVVSNRWFSVAVRFFVPEETSNCIIAAYTLRTTDARVAMARGAQIFLSQMAEEMPFVTLWTINVQEIPEPHASRLEEDLRVMMELEQARMELEPEKKETGEKGDPDPDSKILHFPKGGKKGSPSEDKPKK